MTEKTLADEIITIIQSEANNNPAPEKCVIKKVYDDGYVDVMTDYQYYRYIECLGSNSMDTTGVIVFLYGDETNPIVITSGGGGGGDLSDYIKKSTTPGLVKNDGTIDTTAYSTFSGDYDDLTNKPTIPSDVSELTDTYDTPFTPKTHTHSTWTSTTLNAYVTLYVNEALHLCEVKFTRTFSRATEYTDYNWYSGLIPEDYRPPDNAYGAMSNGGTLYITPEGNVRGYVIKTFETSFTLTGSVMYHY